MSDDVIVAALRLGAAIIGLAAAIIKLVSVIRGSDATRRDDRR